MWGIRQVALRGITCPVIKSGLIILTLPAAQCQYCLPRLRYMHEIQLDLMQVGRKRQLALEDVMSSAGSVGMTVHRISQPTTYARDREPGPEKNAGWGEGVMRPDQRTVLARSGPP